MDITKICLLLGAVFFSSIMAKNGTMLGTGTAADPYLIEDYLDLRMVGLGGASGYSLGSVYRLTADINASASFTDNGGVGFKPIGYSDVTVSTTKTPFNGRFHGGGHIIKNLYINLPAFSLVGMFSEVHSNGRIDSLGLVSDHRKVFNNEYSFIPYTIRGYQFVGALAGRNSGTITECFTNQGVGVDHYYSGGLVGYNQGLIQNSYSIAQVYADPNGAGGIAGAMNNSGQIATTWSSTRVEHNVANKGGISGYTDVSGIYTNNYWDSLAWTFSSGSIKKTAGATAGSFTTAGGLTTLEMKSAGNFTGFDFTNVWKIRDGLSHPGLRGVYNPPVAVMDFFAIHGGPFDLKQLLLNDASVESANAKLTLRVLWHDKGTTDSVSSFEFPTNANYGDIAKLTYIVGEVRASDTLWGNVVPVKLVRLGMEGAGTDADPYLIADYIDLRHVGSSATAMTMVYRVIADIDASTSATTAGMNSIGANIAEFSGKFHGGGHQIKSFTSGNGLFSVVATTGFIDSVVLVNPKITAGGNNVGAMVAVNKGIIRDSKVLSGSVRVEVQNAIEIGGFVGYNQGKIYGAYASDSVITSTTSGGDVGGLVGNMNFSSGALIADSRFDGYVQGFDRVGGIVGLVYNAGSKVIRCINTGKVIGYAAVGGIVGQNSWASDAGGTIDSSYNTGNVIASGDRAGGIVGFGSKGGKIRYSYNTGAISGPQYIGGIVGGWYGTANTASGVDSIVNSYNTGRITSGGVAGGIVGHGNHGGGTFMAMDRCYNAGWVRGVGGSAGGLLGASNNQNTNIVVTKSIWDKETSQQDTSAVIAPFAGLRTADMLKAENYGGWDFNQLWKFRNDSTTYPGFQFVDNAPLAFAESFDLSTDSMFIRLPVLLGNDRDMQTGNANLVLKVDSISSGTISADSASWVRFDDASKNRDSILVTYRIGEVRNSDTLWGNHTRSKIWFVSPWRNTYYALYAGSALNTGTAGTPTVSDLITLKTPTITATAGMDNTQGVMWADIDEESLSAKGLNYVDDFAYVNGKAISHIVANIKPTAYYGGDTVNTLMTQGFMPTSGNGYYPWIRVAAVHDSLHLDFVVFNISGGTIQSIAHTETYAIPAPASGIFNGKWLPVHMMIQNISGTARVAVYLGSSLSAATSIVISHDYPVAYFNPAGSYSTRRVEIPEPGAVARTPTLVDQKLGGAAGIKAGMGSALVGDFAMISSPTMNRADLVHGYLSPWKHGGSGSVDSLNYVVETSQPIIKQILYAAPGDQSTVSYTKTTSNTSTMSFSYGTDFDFDAFAGLNVSPELLTGEIGADIKVGVHFAMSNEGENSFATSTEASAGYSTDNTAGDLVISQTLLTAHHMYLRPRIRYLFAANDTDPFHHVPFVATIPKASSAAEAVQTVTSFLETYDGNLPVLKNFWNLYAKDSTGKIREDLINSGKLVLRSGSEGRIVFNGLASKSLTKNISSEKSVSQTYSVTGGFFVNVDLTYCGARAGFDMSFDATRGEQKSTNTTNTFETNVVFQDDERWDQHDVKIYDDLRFGVPVFELQENNSFTSGPNEPNSNPVTEIASTLTETSDSIHAGDTVKATILVKNNSSNLITSKTIDSVQVKVEPTPNFQGVYKLVTMDPVSFELARGESNLVTIKYVALSETKTPISFWINDGFIENNNFNYIENGEVVGTKTVGPKREVSSSSSNGASSSSSAQSSSSEEKSSSSSAQSSSSEEKSSSSSAQSSSSEEKSSSSSAQSSSSEEKPSSSSATSNVLISENHNSLQLIPSYDGIKYMLPVTGWTKLSILDISGRNVIVSSARVQSAGNYFVAPEIKGGTYLVVLEQGNLRSTVLWRKWR